MIYPDQRYIESLESVHFELLGVRRKTLSKHFLKNICKPDSKPNYLLEKNLSTHNTRNPPICHCPIPRTER